MNTFFVIRASLTVKILLIVMIAMFSGCALAVSAAINSSEKNVVVKSLSASSDFSHKASHQK